MLHEYHFSFSHFVARLISLFVVFGGWRVLKWRTSPRITYLNDVTWVGWLRHGFVAGASVEVTRKRVVRKKIVTKTHLVFVKTTGADIRCAETNTEVPYWVEHQIDRYIHTKPVNTVNESTAIDRIRKARDCGKM